MRLLLIILMLLASPAWAERIGSGFVIGHARDASFLLTNHHVIDRCAEIGVDIPSRPDVEVLAIDDVNDLAVLKTYDLSDRPAAAFRKGALDLAEPVYALGYPLGELLSRGVKITSGIVNATGGLYNDPRFIQIDAAVQPGNSGGPLTDVNGKVGGVVTAILDPRRHRVVQRVNFALKADVVKRFLTKARIPFSEDGSRSPNELADMTVPLLCRPGQLKVARNLADEEEAHLDWLPWTSGRIAVRRHHGQFYARLDFADCEGRYGGKSFDLICGERTIRGTYDAERDILTGLDDQGNLAKICIGQQRCPTNPFKAPDSDHTWDVYPILGGEPIAVVETNFGRVGISCTSGTRMILLSHFHHYYRPFVGIQVDQNRPRSFPALSSLPPTPTETNSVYTADLPDRLIEEIREGRTMQLSLNGNSIGRLGLDQSASALDQIGCS